MFLNPQDRHVSECPSYKDDYLCYFCGRFIKSKEVFSFSNYSSVLYDTIKNSWVHTGCYEKKRKDEKTSFR